MQLVTPLLRLVTPAIVTAVVLVGTTAAAVGATQQTGPTVVDPNLEVRTVVTGLNQPITMAFIGANDMLVLEKATGRVQRVIGGAVHSTALDLAVNSGSERGLLGIALHPNFPANPRVYLYWTESSTGVDTAVLSETPLLGNRVDSFLWDGSTLMPDANIIKLRALQQDADQPARGNHDGGVIAFGPDGKLYIFVGDVGRRGHLQNLRCGPFACGVPDDQFGGPEPDNAHVTGAIFRLNADGSTPTDNPFFAAGEAIGGEVGANVQKIYSYGHRNSFGFAFDPRGGGLWLQENGDDTFTELNRVEPGMNGGWVQIMGPIERLAQYKAIETSLAFDPVTGTQYFGLQQVRWPPTNIADSPAEALARLFMLPGSHYSDPEFSWKFEVSPAGVGFLDSRALGAQYRNDMFVGAARTFLADGFLWRIELTGNGRNVATDDPRLEDKVADNNHKFDITESESLLFGEGFGIATDVETGPNGNLFVVSLTDGAVYEIARR
jgi:glucose/arabinose dehydrogenase